MSPAPPAYLLTSPFPPLRRRIEFLDWLVLSDARHAVVTADSTFGGSARARSGYFNGRWDLAVTREVAAGPAARADAAERRKTGGRGLRCERVAPVGEVCDACTRVGELCPKGVRAECAPRVSE